MKRLSRLALLSFCLATPASSALAGQQDELDHLRKRINALQQELDKTSESRNEAADALRESERAISNSNRRLNELAAQQHEATRALTQLQQQAERLERDAQSEQAMLGGLLYQQYLGGKRQYLQLLLDNRDPNQAARDLQYYEYIARSRAAWLRVLREHLAQVNAVANQSRQKTEEIAALQREATSEMQQLEQDKRTRQQALHKVAFRLQQQRHEIDRLQHNEARLSQLVERLAQLHAQDEKMPFESLKGRLPPPVKGKRTNKFGAHRADSPVLWKGWLLRAPTGQPVRAIAGGRVVFADWLRGFGNLLIIDHGKGYMSLYGNNETLYKQVGEIVHSGDTIAAVGDSGGNDNSGLYFELRYQGTPLDPAKWIAAK